MAKQRMTRKLNDAGTHFVFDIDNGAATVDCKLSDLNPEFAKTVVELTKNGKRNLAAFMCECINKIVGDYVSGDTKDGKPEFIANKLNEKWTAVCRGEFAMRGDGTGGTVPSMLIEAIARQKFGTKKPTDEQLVEIANTYADKTADMDKAAKKEYADTLKKHAAISAHMAEIKSERAAEKAKALKKTIAEMDGTVPFSF